MATLIYRPERTALIKAHPGLFVLPVLTMLAIATVPCSMRHDRHRWAFVSSAAAVLGLFALVGAGMFRTLVRAMDPALSLTVYHAASSPATLSIVLVIALLGIPFVLAYTVGIHWIFRGKVRLDSISC